MRSPMAQCVLAIDDSPEVLALIGVRLRPEGLRFMTATSGEEGIAISLRSKPDLVLLDVDMPDQSGLDVCRRLKADPTTAGIPIIFLTATEDVTTKVHCFDLGAVDYVTKPFHPDELRARVRSALRMKRAQDMLGREAQVDVVTGLRTRGYFDERLPSEVSVALSERRSLSLLWIEVDYLHSLVGTFGHPFGDMILQRVAEVIGRALSASDAACHFGSNELAILLPRASLADAVAIAKAIHDGVRNVEFSPRGRRVIVTTSVGVAEVHQVAAGTGSADGAMLLGAAKMALAIAKREGRDCVRTSNGQVPDEIGYDVSSARVDSDSRSGWVLLDKYVLDRKIGEGGMGAVYRAMHITLGELVAVKFLHDVWKWSNEHRSRFRREASILSRLRHPGIVSILDFGELDNELFMVMELVKGRPLAQAIRSEAGLSHARIGAIFGEILSILAVAHAENVVHRDIKPENVMVLDSAEGADRIKVLDFGIAYLADAPEGVGRLTGTGEFRGTAHYMAPEQWSNREVGPGADVYAVGVMLYEALSGRLPFDGDSLPAIIMQHVLAEPPPLLSRGTNLPVCPALEALVKSALAKSSADRPTARELATQLTQLLSGEDGISTAAREAVVPPVSGSRLIAVPRVRDHAGNE